MINLKFAELHHPLFLNGTNLAQKIDITKRANLLIQYDEKKEMLLVWFNHNLGLIPKESVAVMVPINIEDTGYAEPEILVKIQAPQTSPMARPNTQAQVSTPHDHVFVETAGKSGIGQRIK